MRKGWDKTWIREFEDQTKFGPKSSIEPEPKLFKYLKGFKILISIKKKLMITPKYYGYPNISKSYLYT